METPNMLQIFLFFNSIVNYCSGMQEVKVPELIGKDAYCLGCGYTVKAIERLMQQPSSDSVDFRVAEALDSVCHKDHLSDSEMSANTLLKACEYIIENYQPRLEPLLVSHYSRFQTASQSTYLEIYQQACNHVINACEQDTDSDSMPGFQDFKEFDVEFDAETHGFTVTDESKVRMPKPMKARREDL